MKLRVFTDDSRSEIVTLDGDGVTMGDLKREVCRVLVIPISKSMEMVMATHTSMEERLKHRQQMRKMGQPVGTVMEMGMGLS